MSTIETAFDRIDPYVKGLKDCLTVISLARYTAILLGRGGSANTLKAIKSPFLLPCLVYQGTRNTYRVGQECSYQKSFIAANIGIGVFLLSIKALQSIIRLETTHHLLRRSLKIHLIFTQFLLMGFSADKAIKDPGAEQLATLTYRTLSVVKQGLKEAGFSEETRAAVGLVKGATKLGVSYYRHTGGCQKSDAE